MSPAAPPPVALLFLRGRDADGRIRRLVTERRTLRRLEDENGANAPARAAVTFSAPPEAANLFRLAIDAGDVILGR